jgi:small subunit ribosomal protein S17
VSELKENIQKSESRDGTEKKPIKKVRIGTIISNKMDKTVVAKVEILRKHPTYGKYVKKTRKFKVHDEKNECNVGDIIKFVETRPISKEKCWKLVEIIERAK